MAADAVVTRELQSLQDELSAAQRERTAATAPPPLARPDPSDPAPETADEQELRIEFTLR